MRWRDHLRRAAPRAALIAAIATVAALAGAGCGQAAPHPPASFTGSSPAAAAAAPAGTLPSLDHVVVVVMENHEYGDIIGNRQARYVNRLAGRFALARRSYAVDHPSLPNYLALVGGSTFGIHTDCTRCSVKGANLADQLDAAHISWRAYIEDLPARCSAAAGAGGYAKRHNPFFYFRSLAADRNRCGQVVPLARLRTDLRGAGLPRFAWITPNLCHDMHDCGVAAGDRFLASWVPRVLPALGRNGILVLTWDEGNSNRGCCRAASGGHIATILAGPGARRGARSRVPYDHYSVLKTIEDSWRLPELGWAACACTNRFADLLAPGRS